MGSLETKSASLLRLAGGGAWLSIACIVALVLEPYFPSRDPWFSSARVILNIVSDLALLPLPFALWRHAGGESTRSNRLALGLGLAGIATWLAADAGVAIIPTLVQNIVGGIASLLLAAWIFLVCRRALAEGLLPGVLARVGMLGVPGLVFAGVLSAMMATVGDQPAVREGPPPAAEALISQVLIFGPLWVWLVMLGSYLLSLPDSSSGPDHPR